MIRINVNHARVQREYFELLNPRNKDGSYSKKEALLELIRKEASQPTYSSVAAKDFFAYITDEANLRQILLASATDLASSQIDNLYNHICYKHEKEAIKDYFTKRYDSFRQNDNVIKFIQEVTQIRVCPYCNINYIYSIESTQTEDFIALFQLDHFKDKATYPYLALSFYNLVPSCSSCNASLKHSKPIQFNPHGNGIENEYVFRTAIKTADYFAYKSDSFDITLCPAMNNSPNEAFESNKEVFKLETRYALHKAEVIDLIKKGIIYNESYLTSLYEQYRDTVFSSEQEVKQLVLGNYLHPEDFYKRPLSKLTRDIAKDLGLL